MRCKKTTEVHLSHKHGRQRVHSRYGDIKTLCLKFRPICRAIYHGGVLPRRETDYQVMNKKKTKEKNILMGWIIQSRNVRYQKEKTQKDQDKWGKLVDCVDLRGLKYDMVWRWWSNGSSFIIVTYITVSLLAGIIIYDSENWLDEVVDIAIRLLCWSAVLYTGIMGSPCQLPHHLFIISFIYTWTVALATRPQCVVLWHQQYPESRFLRRINSSWFGPHVQ